jgi:hypothetical protein
MQAATTSHFDASHFCGWKRLEFPGAVFLEQSTDIGFQKILSHRRNKRHSTQPEPVQLSQVETLEIFFRRNTV